MSDKLKKQLILNLPYILIGLYATKLGEAWRLAEGADASQKFLHLMDGFTAAFQSPLPSFHLSDLLIGLVIGCVLRLLPSLLISNAELEIFFDKFEQALLAAGVKPV